MTPTVLETILTRRRMLDEHACEIIATTVAPVSASSAPSPPPPPVTLTISYLPTIQTTPSSTTASASTITPSTSTDTTSSSI